MNDSTTPPRPRRWLRWLKRLGWCALWLVTAIALLVQFENWRGRRAWAQFVAELKATGDDPGLAAAIPPPVSDEENLAMTPLFRPVSEIMSTPRGPERTALFSKIDTLQKMTVVGPNPPKSKGGWRGGKFTDLAAWQAHYRTDTNFPSPPEPRSPGADILFALGKLEPELGLLRQSVARPKSRFPVRYEDSFGALLPHATQMKKLTILLQMRAVAELAEKQVDEAATDTLLALRMMDALAEEPFLISHLIRIAQLEIAMAPVWEGLARRQWSEGQLAAFESRLKGMDFAADYRLAIRGERNIGAFAGLDLMRKEPKSYAELEDVDGGGSGWSALRFMPAAFTDQSKVVMGRMYSELLKDISSDSHRFSRTHAVEVERQAVEIKSMAWRRPYSILASLLMPALTKSVEKFAGTQGTIDLARVAIALERHRLKHGAFPETLEGVDPALQPAGGLPHDVISGGPLRYARTADGRFHLYAVGWNGTDEGGSVAWKNSEKTQIDFTQGDWVWPQPASNE